MKKRTYLVILLLLISTISLGCVNKEEKTAGDTKTDSIVINDTNTDVETGNTPIINPTNAVTKVTIKGRQLLVNGNPFIIRGVGYSPTPIGEDPESKYKDFYSYKYKDIYDRDIPLIRGMGANTIRLWAWNNTEDHGWWFYLDNSSFGD